MSLSAGEAAQLKVQKVAPQAAAPSADAEAADAQPEEELDDDQYFVKHTCKANCRNFLTKARGMTDEEAHRFIDQHLTFNCEFTNREWCCEPDTLRSLRHRIVFKNQIAIKGQQAPVEAQISCFYRYHHRARASFTEHFAELHYSVEGPESASGMVFEVDVDAKKHNKFKLTKKNAKVIHSVFPAGWSGLHAMIFLYAALGVNWSDKTARLKSPAEETALNFDDSFVEAGTYKACGFKN